jgi:phospholipase D1/2
LDLTTGRWDTPSHNLFSTLKTYHRDDYYQGYENFQKEFGPREPWHDIHCLVEGPAAHDVMTNFVQRWRKQVYKHRDVLEVVMQSNVLLPINADIIQGSHTWNVQLFRSIDDHSAEIDGKRDLIEHGIYDAYLHNIRRARQFIYIENQYFIGSSQYWFDFDEKKYNVECKHRIPIEIASKIVHKIVNNERFTVYIVIPMHPEGPGPEAPAVQAILHWQYKTAQMMYSKIAEALRDTKSSAVPTDYLNFYFLGNREPAPPAVLPNDACERQKKICSSGRHMIYVHSKMMIIDDEYIIVGSANINERSMAGDRDTEIAVGMHQPSHVMTGNCLPRGEVAGFRMSLWGEHTNICEPVFQTPCTVECVRRINQIADYNWICYASPTLQPMGGHLCKYPYLVQNDGTLSAVQECFPDMHPGGKILGEPQDTVPNLLTT